jgi:tetratricopeptide (TPR) repeat protein
MNESLTKKNIDDDQRKYRVVFEGKLVNGVSEKDVEIKVAQIYGKETSEISKLFNGKKVIIKKNASILTCENIKEKFYKAGAECSIELENKSLLDSGSEVKTVDKSKVIKIENYKKKIDYLDYKSIIQALSTELTGNTENDLKYLCEQHEKYIDHPNSIEIDRAIGRLIFDVLPIKERKYIEAYYGKLDLSTDIILEEVNNKIRSGDLDNAEKIVSSIMPSEEYFMEDEESRYFAFNNLFETAFYFNIFKPKKQVRYISNFVLQCSMKYAYILFETKEYDKAIQILDRGLYYNPIDLKLLYEKGEIYKIRNDWEKFKEINDFCLNVAYTRSDIARAYRNYGYMYIEKSDLDAAACCYLLSTLFEKNEHANSQLFYISQKKKKIIDHKKYFKNYCKIFDKRGIPFGLSEDVRNTIMVAGKYHEEKNQIEEAIYFYELLYSLTEDDEVLNYIDKLKKNS